MSQDAMAKFKEAQRQGWKHFAPLEALTTPAAARLVGFARVRAGQEVLDVGLADVVLIDNFDVPTMKKAVAMVAGRLVIEASGGINLDTIAEIAATGVDYASSGALTHSVMNLDVGLDIEI